LNKGTTVAISIPAIQANKMVDQNELKEKPHFARTILIAEDEHSNYLYLSELLIEELDTKILYAMNGQQAVEICKANKEVDLILMDIKMPIMDGHQAAMLIKEFRPDLPIIAQTAYALNSEKEKFTGVFDDYISKPIKAAEFKQKIKKYLMPLG